jgi:hypothetical protein
VAAGGFAEIDLLATLRDAIEGRSHRNAPRLNSRAKNRVAFRVLTSIIE